MRVRAIDHLELLASQVAQPRSISLIADGHTLTRLLSKAIEALGAQSIIATDLTVIRAEVAHIVSSIESLGACAGSINTGASIKIEIAVSTCASITLRTEDMTGGRTGRSVQEEEE